MDGWKSGGGGEREKNFGISSFSVFRPSFFAKPAGAEVEEEGGFIDIDEKPLFCRWEALSGGGGWAGWRVGRDLSLFSERGGRARPNGKSCFFREEGPPVRNE